MPSKIALDTNAYRALDDGHAEVVQIVKLADSVGIPTIVLGELYHGIFLGSRGSQNLEKLNKWLALPRVGILEIDEVTAKLFGEIAASQQRIGRPIQQNDIWIAALCKQHGYTLLTADKDFDSVTGLDILNFA